MPLSGCLSSNWEIGTHTQNHQGKKSKGVECFWKRLIRHCAPPRYHWRMEAGEEKRRTKLYFAPPALLGITDK